MGHRFLRWKAAISAWWTLHNDQPFPLQEVELPVVFRLLLLHLGDEGCNGRRPTAAHELGGSALRLLHQLAHATTAAEALARASPPAVPTLLAATRWAVTFPTIDRLSDASLALRYRVCIPIDSDMYCI